MVTLLKKSHICIELFGYVFHLHYFKKKVIQEVNELEVKVKFADKVPSVEHASDIVRLIELKDSIDWYLENKP